MTVNYRLASTMSSLLVGRAEAVEEVLTALAGERLVTLQGPPGIGKTRMAVEVLSAVAGQGRRTAFAYLVDVDGEPPEGWDYDDAPDLESIARAVQSALGVTHISSSDPVEVLVSHLSGDTEPLLLVLDNCERIRTAVGDLVAILLDVAPGLQVLATSRAELGLPVERLIPLRPLSIPAGDADDSAGSEAMSLLEHLVSSGGMRIPADQAAQARALVRWSGGLPLVLEFIAARLRSGLTPDTVLRRLDGGGLLTTHGTRRRAQPHQRTLRQVLDDSFELCLAAERTLFLRTACFAGGFDLAEAEAVCAGNGIAPAEVIDLLGGLTEKALCTVDPATGRYGMLPPIAEYAVRKLRECGEEDQVRRAHAEHFATLARQAADTWLDRSRELAWLAVVGRELDNLRAAMAWLRDHGSPWTALEIALNLARLRFWWFSGLLAEGANLLRRLLDECPPDPTPLRVAATAMRSWMVLCQGDQEGAAAALTACRRLVDGEPPAMLDFLEGAHALLVRADAETALPLLRRAVAKLTAAVESGLPLAGDRHQAHMILGLAVGLIGTDRREAEEVNSAVLAEALAADAPSATSWARWDMGVVALLFKEDPAEALAYFQEGLRTQVEIGDRWGTVWTATAICWALARAARGRRAAVLHGASTRQQERVGSKATGLKPFRNQTDIARRIVVDQTGPAIFEEEYRRGREMGPAEVYELAMRPLEGPRPPALPRTEEMTEEMTLADLTPAEAQIARMVAEGLRTNDIARRTGRSTRTVNTHITRIYQKVGGVNSRPELAMWVQRVLLGRDH